MATKKKAWVAPRVTTLRLTPELTALFPVAKISQAELATSGPERSTAQLADGEQAR